MMDVDNKSLPLLEAIERQKELERQLAGAKRSAARYDRLFNNSALGILIGTEQGVIVDANPRGLDLLGYGREELLGRCITDFIHPDDLARVSIFEGPKAAVAGRTFQVDRRLLRKDGSYLDTRVHFAVYDADQTLYQMLFQDITAERSAMAATEAALTLARTANAAKSVFLANMSHEIRTPLNGIMGMLQLALASSPPEEIRDYLETALVSSEALLRVLSDVLDVARLDSGRLTLCQDVFSLSDIIGPTVDFFAHEARLKGLGFATHVDPDAPESLCGDPARLRQILHNLLANAVKYTASGSVRLDVRVLETDEEDGVLLECGVADTGIGIPPEKQKTIFDAFSQADASLTRPYGGCGLGLTIVKGLTSLMGGSLHICSDVGQGTTVRLRLRLPYGRMTCRQPQTRPRPHLEGFRVLVVEDERINQLTIAAMLRKFGCAYELCGNGLEALARLAVAHFDCVLMDMQMPELDGLETTRRIRAGVDVLDAAVPVIALTAHAQDADRDAALAAGVDDYVSKPVDMDDLARAIAKRLGIYYG